MDLVTIFGIVIIIAIGLVAIALVVIGEKQRRITQLEADLFNASISRQVLSQSLEEVKADRERKMQVGGNMGKVLQWILLDYARREEPITIHVPERYMGMQDVILEVIDQIVFDPDYPPLRVVIVEDESIPGGSNELD
jgi:hypothetical protein